MFINKKHIKYLISILLIVSLTISESYIHTTTNSVKYHQVSCSNSRENKNDTNSRANTHLTETLPKKKRAIILTVDCNLQDVYSNQALIVLKKRRKLYKEIESIITDTIFLNKRLRSSNQYSSLYKA